MDKEIVYTFSRNKDEKVCTAVSLFKDRVYVDFRVYFIDKESGELRPTKKGLTIARDLLPNLKSAILACEKHPVEQAAASAGVR